MSDWMQRARYMDETPRGGNKQKISFAFRHEVQLNRNARNILFVEAAYPAYNNPEWVVPFFEWRRHSFRDMRNGREFFRSFMCTRGNTSASCPACDLQFARNPDARFAIRNVKYWPVIDLDWYYEITNKYGDPPYYAQPENRAQEMEWANEYKKVYGKLGYIEIGKAHNQQLLDIFDHVTSMCVGCVEEGHKKPSRVQVTAYQCSGCGHEFDNVNTTSMSQVDWAKAGYTKAACPKCGKNDLPKQVIGCRQCKSPRRAEIYDVVLPLVKTGTGKDTAINMEFGSTPIFVDDWNLPDGSPLMDGLNANGSRAWSPQIVQAYHSLDFKSVFADELDPSYANSIING
jgi:DNA-directed RNA polymerase subunit RPC12/RpoP